MSLLYKINHNSFNWHKTINATPLIFHNERVLEK